MDEDELRIILNKKIKRFNRKDILKIEKNQYKTMGVQFTSITIIEVKTKYKLYFEDVTQDNIAYYENISNELKRL